MHKIKPQFDTYEKAISLLGRCKGYTSFSFFAQHFDSFVLSAGKKIKISIIRGESEEDHFGEKDQIHRLILNEDSHKTTFNVSRTEYNGILKDILELAENHNLKCKGIYIKEESKKEVENALMEYGIFDFSLVKNYR